MPWLFLVISGIEEVIAAIAMKYVDGTRKNGRLLSWYWGLLCLFSAFRKPCRHFQPVLPMPFGPGSAASALRQSAYFGLRSGFALRSSSHLALL